MENYQWGFRSLSYWLTLITALGIIFIGLRYILSPHLAAIGFGIPLPEGKSALYGSIKGIRDIFSGLVLFYPLWIRSPRVTAFIFSTAIIVPATDCILVLTANGSSDWPHLLIHGGTALFMLINSILLFREKSA